MKKSVYTRRKILSLLLSSVMILTALPLSGFSAFALSVISGDYEYKKLSGSTIEIVKYRSDLTVETLDIPGEIDGYTVTSLGSSSFSNLESTSVTIPDSVTNIGFRAFSSCSNLTGITIPDRVTNIDNYAFDGCSSLTSLTIPNSVISIGSHAFYYCSGLTSLTISDSVTSIGDYAFSGCKGLTSVTIPKSITSISDRMFSYCSGLKEITIPDNITNIGYEAFYSCTGLKRVTIGAGLTSIGLRAFNSCYDLEWIEVDGDNKCLSSLDGVLFNKDKTELLLYPQGNAREEYAIPDGVVTIGGGAFSVSQNLKHITISDSVKSIGSSAFSACIGLRGRLIIPESVESIGYGMLMSCDRYRGIDVYIYNKDCDIYLDRYTIPKASTIYGYKGSTAEAYANQFGNKFVAIDEIKESMGLEYRILDDGTAEITGYTGNITALNIPNEIDGYTVTSLADWLFFECDSLTSVKIPETITNIGWCAFTDCPNLTSITVAERNEFYSSQDGVLFNKDATELIQFPISNPITEYKLPSTVKIISHEAFWGCENLTSVTLPIGTKEIDNYAFAYCKSLTKISILSSVYGIGAYAFLGCDQLSDIFIFNIECFIDIWAIPLHTTIHGYPSYNYLNSTAEAYAKNYGNEFVPLEKSDVSKIFEYRVLEDDTAEITFYSGFSDVVTIPDEIDGYPVSSINISIFWPGRKGDVDLDRSLIKKVVIPETVISVTEEAFDECIRLESIEVDENNPRYSSLNGVLFNKDKTELIMFPVDSKITSYEIPDSVTKIGECAFEACAGLTSVIIPDSVTVIGAAAFSSCSGLTSIIIPYGVTDISDSVFEYCTGLESVVIPDTVTSIGEFAFESCTGLTSVTLNKNVTYLDYAVFNNCSNLSDIYIMNRDCHITYDDDYSYKRSTIPLNTTIHGYKGSTAQDYADKYGNEFVPFPAPELNVTATVDGEEYNGEYTAKEIVITAEADAEIFCSFDGGEWIKWEESSINAENGEHTYAFMAINDLDIESDVVTVVTKREIDSPVLNIEVTGTLGEWTKDDISFKFSAENINSGVTYYYSTDDSEWIKIEGDILTVSENTNTKYIFKCVNGAGSESEISQEYAVMIDKTVPNGFIAEMQKTENGVTITLSEGESKNAVQYQYSVNGGEWTDVEGDSVSFTEPGEYSISFRAVSVSGVVSDEVVLTFTISEPIVDAPEPDNPTPDDPTPDDPTPDDPTPDDPTPDDPTPDDPTPDDPTPDDPEPNELKGDVNGDGKISIVDAKWILQYIAGTREFDEKQKKVANLNGDEKVSVIDAKWVLQIVANLRDAETLELY